MTESGIRTDLKALVDAAGTDSQQKLDAYYRRLVRKYHPDCAISEHRGESDRLMAAVNVVYARLKSGMTGSFARDIREPEPIDDANDVAYELLKEADSLRDRAMSKIEGVYSPYTNHRVIAEASEDLYRAQVLLTRILTSYPLSMWAHDAESKRRWCHKIVHRVTERLESAAQRRSELASGHSTDA